MKTVRLLYTAKQRLRRKFATAEVHPNQHIKRRSDSPVARRRRSTRRASMLFVDSYMFLSVAWNSLM
jgi:hypothetical protein